MKTVSLLAARPALLKRIPCCAASANWVTSSIVDTVVRLRERGRGDAMFC